MRSIIIDEVDGIDESIEINEVDEAGKKATIVFRNLINNRISVSAPLQLFDAQCSYSVRSAAIRCAAQLFDAQSSHSMRSAAIRCAAQLYDAQCNFSISTRRDRSRNAVTRKSDRSSDGNAHACQSRLVLSARRKQGVKHRNLRVVRRAL